MIVIRGRKNKRQGVIDYLKSASGMVLVMTTADDDMYDLLKGDVLVNDTTLHKVYESITTYEGIQAMKITARSHPLSAIVFEVNDDEENLDIYMDFAESMKFDGYERLDVEIVVTIKSEEENVDVNEEY